MTTSALDHITVFAPATVANLGPGYDVLGLALEAPGDTITAHRTDAAAGVRLTSVTGAGEFALHRGASEGEQGALPPPDARNTACVAATHVLDLLGRPFGVELELRKGLPLGSGLGSSGASAVAAAVAVNLLAGSPLPTLALVDPCARAEEAACGSAHADNVAPGLFGGITLVRSSRAVTRLETPLALWMALVSPEQVLPTREARGAIPREIPIADAVHNVAHAASMVYALARGDLDLLRSSLSDRIAEPRRAPLIPGFPEVQRAALEAGALGSSIAGAGPAIFALCESEPTARRAEEAMSAALTTLGRAHTSRRSAVASVGARAVATKEP